MKGPGAPMGEQLTGAVRERRGEFLSESPQAFSPEHQAAARHEQDEKSGGARSSHTGDSAGGKNPRFELARLGQVRAGLHRHARQAGIREACRKGGAPVCKSRVGVQRHADRQRRRCLGRLHPVESIRHGKERDPADRCIACEGTSPAQVHDVDERTGAGATLCVRFVRPPRGLRPLAAQIDRFGGDQAAQGQVKFCEERMLQHAKFHRMVLRASATCARERTGTSISYRQSRGQAGPDFSHGTGRPRHQSSQHREVTSRAAAAARSRCAETRPPHLLPGSRSARGPRCCRILR